MSDMFIATPRTDLETRMVWSKSNEGMGDEYGELVVSASFAKELEVELKELTRRNELLSAANKDTKRIAEERNRLHDKLAYLLIRHDTVSSGGEELMKEAEWEEIRKMLRPLGL
jgi:hypothetical protein